MRAVLDTSVLISAHRHWLWLLAKEGYYRAVWSPFITGELVRIRVERAIQFDQDRVVYRARVNELIHLLSDVCEVVNYRDSPVSGVLKDPDDDPILATALAGKAELIVSLNTRDFPTDGVAMGIRFITPGGFLAELVAQYPESQLETRSERAGRQIP